MVQGRMVRGRAVAGALALALSMSLASPLAAQGTADDPVVARVDGSEIRRSEVLTTIATLPEQYRQLPQDVLFGGVLTQMIDRRLMAQAAQSDKLGDDPEVRRRLAAAEERVLQEVWLIRKVDQELTEERLKAQYEAKLKDNPTAEEVHARHILLDDEAAARQVIEELRKGGDFTEIAKAKSTGPSAGTGGDLGYFSRDQMVPEFSEAAFAMQAGEVSSEPVKTQFGWHVIKVEDRRTAPPPTFEDSQDELRNELAQDVIAGLVEDLRAKAKVEQFNADGSVRAPEPEMRPLR